jgi:hypothetical protein
VSTFSEMDAEYLIRTRISRVAIIEWWYAQGIRWKSERHSWIIEKERDFPGVSSQRGTQKSAELYWKSLNVCRILLKVAERHRIDLNYARNIQERPTLKVQ